MTRPRGFTLLELLIAVAVLGMLLVLLNQGVSFGFRAAAMQTREDARQGDLAAVDHALRGMLEQADPGIYPEPATLKGTASVVEMITDIPSPAGDGTMRVAAALLVEGDQLRLRWTPRRHVTPIGPAPRPSELTLLSGVRGLGIEYFGVTGWQDSWTAQTLPALIRLKLSFQDEKRHWPTIIAAPQREPVLQ